ncbi:MAG: hypothetical protein N5P05_004597 [Chroococcopsis gigantea SAG 12.99]|nr:hypothetical protein [Chroococcopsis gigantea SAG 12.99]
MGAAMRRAAKIDRNQTQIVAHLRKMGCSVLHLHTVGHGCPDLLVGYGGANFLVEVKSATGKLTPDQEKFFNSWRGQVAIARSIDEAMAICTKSVL